MLDSSGGSVSTILVIVEYTIRRSHSVASDEWKKVLVQCPMSNGTSQSAPFIDRMIGLAGCPGN